MDWTHHLAYQLTQLYTAYCNICSKGQVYFHQEQCAQPYELAALEQALSAPIPPSLRSFLLLFSKNIRFQAYLPDTLVLPESLCHIFSACFEISLEEILHAEQERSQWVERCFYRADDPYDQIWHQKLGFMTVPNGDILAFDCTDPKQDKRVVYLSHDDSEGHGVVLGESFQAYFQALLYIGGCGNEDCQMLPFVDSSKGLCVHSQNAAIYRRLIGLS